MAQQQKKTSTTKARTKRPRKTASRSRKTTTRRPRVTKAAVEPTVPTPAPVATPVAAPVAATPSPPPPPKRETSRPKPPTPTPSSKATPAGKVPVNVAVERRLIDKKIVMPDEASTLRFFKVMVYAVILGGLAGASVIAYLKITAVDDVAREPYVPRITVTEEEDEVMEEETATSTEEETEDVMEPVRVVEILDTPTGWLNVRSGPGTSNSQITRVTPGDAYILVSTDEASGWLEIRLDDGSTGWITGQYGSVK